MVAMGTLRELLEDLAAAGRCGLGYVQLTPRRLFIATTDRPTAQALAARWGLSTAVRSSDRTGYDLHSWRGQAGGRTIEVMCYRPQPADGASTTERRYQYAVLRAERWAHGPRPVGAR